MRLKQDEDGFTIDASLLGELLDVPPSGVHPLMRSNEITSLCERGEGEHAGQYRLTFFYRGRRARLSIDESGTVIRRSIVDLGDRRLPSSAERSRGPRPTEGGGAAAAGRATLKVRLSDTPSADDGPRPSPGPPRPAQEAPTRQAGGSAQGMGAVRVQDLLARARDRLVTIDAGVPLTEAAEFLFAPDCRMIVVCDPAGVMMGVITRTDVIRQIRHCQGCACATQCRMIMTKEVVACQPDDRLDETWAAMKEKELFSIPVIDPERRPIGLLSARDALESLLASVEYEEGLLRDYVMSVGYR